MVMEMVKQTKQDFKEEGFVELWQKRIWHFDRAKRDIAQKEIAAQL